MPEIAEREPKVISVWSVLFGCLYLEVLVRMVQAQRGRGPGDSLVPPWCAPVLRKWCSLPRLETRTKESDTGASIVVSNHSAQ